MGAICGGLFHTATLLVSKNRKIECCDCYYSGLVRAKTADKARSQTRALQSSWRGVQT